MKAKVKCKEIMKVAAVSTLALGLFSAALTGVNHAAFASTTGQTTTLPQIISYISVPENLPPQGFTAPILGIYDRTGVSWGGIDTDIVISDHALSIDEAAQIGAKYIWEMFGESIDGMAVEMQYTIWPSSTRPYWVGVVGLEPRPILGPEDIIFVEETLVLSENGGQAVTQIRLEFREGIEMPQMLFQFTIDAVTGERIDVINKTRALDNDDTITEEELLRITQIEFQAMHDGTPNPFAIVLTSNQIETYSQLARNFSQKHFTNSTVVDVEFVRSWAAAWGRNTDGDIVATAHILNFNSTDDTGRTANISINMGSQQLLEVITHHNDLAPGFSVILN